MAGIRIAGLWEQKTPQGKLFYQGTWGNAVIRDYQNDYKKAEKDPDLVVCLSEKPKEQRSIPKPRVAPNQEKGVVIKAAVKAPPHQNHAPNATRRPIETPEDFFNEPWPDGPDDSDSEAP